MFVKIEDVLVNTHCIQLAQAKVEKGRLLLVLRDGHFVTTWEILCESPQLELNRLQACANGELTPAQERASQGGKA